MSGTELPELPELPVTFRPGPTRAVLLTAGVALFVVVGLIGLLLDGLGPGERISFVFTAALLSRRAVPAGPAEDRRRRGGRHRRQHRESAPSGLGGDPSGEPPLG